MKCETTAVHVRIVCLETFLVFFFFFFLLKNSIFGDGH